MGSALRAVLVVRGGDVDFCRLLRTAQSAVPRARGGDHFQRRKFIEDDGFTEYSALWMLGIMLFILGLIISSFVAYMVLQYGRPGFIYEQAQKAIEVYNAMPEMRDGELVKALQLMVDRHILPTPIEMVFSMFWLVSFLGSVTSAITAFIVKKQTRFNRRY